LDHFHAPPVGSRELVTDGMYLSIL